ncbi:hypothetical protein [Metabacillus sp. cB07]|uniref:hypothetical protein n=1 Tax=Metabacillus sp. cB07 TaxID=2806989 RepID=UPI001939E84D|nr:hypothetical protein [Metabacillus sp. cB07]
MFKNKRRLLATRRVKSGNGRSLKAFRWWQMFSRSVFFLRLKNTVDQQTVFAVEVSYIQQFFSDNGKGKANLYLNGKHYAESKLPAVFKIDGGWIEVKSSVFGMRRCHFVTDDGAVFQLEPDARSAEGRRYRLDRDHPMLSRFVSAISLMMIIIPTVIAIPQVVDTITHIPFVAERFGVFHSPITLSPWLNLMLGFSAVLGSVERATRLKWNALLDGSI